MSTKFNKLSYGQQTLVVMATAMFMNDNPDPDGLPIWPDATPQEWIQAYSAVNPRIHDNWLPFSDDFLTVVEHIENVIQGHIPGVCPCCSTYVAATPCAN